MIDMIIKTALIGHRVINNSLIRDRLKDAIEKTIEKGCKFFIMGNHGEFDHLALEICRELKQKCKDLEIVVVLTSLHVFDKVFIDDIPINPYSDVKTTFYDIEEEHFKRKIIVSNRKMIDECNNVICYVNEIKSSSGAKLTLKYARKRGLNIINLYREEDSPTFGMTTEEALIFWENRIKKIKN